MRRLLTGIALLVAALAAAGAALAVMRDEDERGAPSASGGGDGRHPVLVVSQELESKETLPVEGAVSFLRVSGPGIPHSESRFLDQDFTVTYSAGEPGVFTITSFQRYCGGPCTPRWLAPPSERCSRRVRIGKGETVRVSIRLAFTRGCTIAARAG